MVTRRELKDAIRQRYQAATERRERRQILAELVRVTGYHRKHALRVLNHLSSSPEPRRRERLYDEAVHQALAVLWEAASHRRQTASSSYPGADRGSGTSPPSTARPGGEK